MRYKLLFESLIQSVPIPIFYKDVNGIYLGCNKAFESAIGLTKEEIVGKSVFDLWPADKAAMYHKKDMELFSNPQKEQVYEYVVIDKDGKERSVVFYKNVFCDTDGKVAGLVGSIFDITDQKRVLQLEKELNEELKAMNEHLSERVEHEVATRIQLLKEKELQDDLLMRQSKMAAMGEMIGVIAHQWKQPLAAIQMSADVIEEAQTDEALVRKMCNAIKKQTEFMNQTISTFKNFFKPDKAEQMFSIFDAALDVIEILKPLFKYKVDVEVHKSGDVKAIIGYPNEFKQAILNILVNARDACVQNGVKLPKISLFFESSDGLEVLRIRDNGGGIPESLLPNRIFEANFTTKGDNGSGVGLYICKKIIEEHLGGRVWAQNVGGGAEFVIEFRSGAVDFPKN